MYWIEDGVTLAIVVSAASMVLASGLTIVFVLTRRGWRPTTSTSRDLPDLRRLVDELPVGHGDGELTCAICLDQLEPHEQVKQLPCQHCYHKECLYRWGTSRVCSGRGSAPAKLSCPLCKEDCAIHVAQNG
ncbi:unnamed protein product [Durusdinium trenchii]|uniref:RING-type domain-containing protein n=1 Tax=Durusdinium trenchii TaxID=1381693 RepID=A0ABP0HTJ3_9DINO